MLLRILGFVCALLVPAVADAQIRDSVALERRAAQIAAMIAGAPLNPDTVYSPTLLAQVPAAQLRAVYAQLAQLGQVQRIVIGKPAANAPSAVEFQLYTDKGYIVPMTLSVESAPPNLVNGLLFAGPTKAAATLDDVVKELQALPGHASLFAARINGSQLVPVATLDTGRTLAIGSAFKLYVLAELVREVGSGKRHWADLVLLDSLTRSLPSGILQNWPAGTPMTLQALATLMISQSDNTAADQLLHVLGRESVESVQRAAGNAHAELNQPFLSTRELFVLKTPAAAPLLQRYIAGNAAERRAVLADSALRQPAQPDFGKGPNAIESVEWFASTADLARTMLWIRDHSTDARTAAVRGVLSVNKGIAWPRAAWTYAGFKGGSEPGVINLTFLAQRADGQWFVLVATWNDPGKVVNESAFVALVTRARDLLGGS